MKRISDLKFNVIDFLIIIVVIAIIASVVLRANLIEKFNTDMESISYLLKIEDTTEDMFLNIDIESNVYGEDDILLGKIVSKDKETATVYNVTEDAKMTKIDNPDGKINIYLELEALGVTDEQGTKIDGKYFIAAGKKLLCRTEKIQFDAEIREILVK